MPNITKLFTPAALLAAALTTTAYGQTEAPSETNIADIGDDNIQTIKITPLGTAKITRATIASKSGTATCVQIIAESPEDPKEARQEAFCNGKTDGSLTDFQSEQMDPGVTDATLVEITRVSGGEERCLTLKTSPAEIPPVVETYCKPAALTPSP